MADPTPPGTTTSAAAVPSLDLLASSHRIGLYHWYHPLAVPLPFPYPGLRSQGCLLIRSHGRTAHTWGTTCVMWYQLPAKYP
jgi:hypothetical protein